MAIPNDDLLFEKVPTPRPEALVKRDRWKRYLCPHPETGKEVAWTRATTVAGTLADRFGLEQWAKRNVVLGIGARRDLYAQAAAATPEDKSTLNQIARDAEAAAAADAGANTGSALHRFTERLDAGEVVDPPDPWDKDVAAYRQAMTAHGIAVVPGWLERILLVPEIEVAGTADRLLNTMEWPLPRIGDLKTAKDVLQYSMVEIALQLAIYAHATHWYDPIAEVVHPLELQVDQTLAVVMHLPIGQATCNLYEVDIAAGWDAVRLAIDVRNWRKRKDLAQLMVTSTQWVASEQTPPNGDKATAVEASYTLPSNRLDLSAFVTNTPTPSAAEPTPSGGNGEGVDQGAPDAATTEEGDPSAAEGAPGIPGPIASMPREHANRINQMWEAAQEILKEQGVDLAEDESPFGSGCCHECDAGEPCSVLHAQRLEWLQRRIDAIKAVGDEAKAALAREWSTQDSIPTMPNGGPCTPEEFEVVSGWCWNVEGAFGLTFPEPEPGTEAFIQALQREGMVSG